MKNSLYIITLFIALQFIYSCSTSKSTIDQTVDFVWEYAEENPNGFTLNIETYQLITEGISVSYHETQNSFGKESLYRVVDHSLKHQSVIGGWLNTEDSIYYFDSNRIFPDSLLQDAIEFAKDNEQLAIYDLTNDSTIWIKYNN